MSQNEADDEYMTVAEVAGNLKLNQQTIRNWIDRGELPVVRVGRRVRIKRSDYDRYVQEGYSGSTQPRQRPPEPSAEDFWGGGPIGVPETKE